MVRSRRSRRLEPRNEDQMTRRNPPSHRRRQKPADPGSLEAQLAAIDAEAADLKMQLMVEIARRQLRLLKLPPENPPRSSRV